MLTHLFEARPFASDILVSGGANVLKDPHNFIVTLTTVSLYLRFLIL
jgi:hypothetical protein